MNLPMTHPQTAWLVHAVPVCLALAAVLLCVLLLRGRLSLLLTSLLERRGATARTATVEPALQWLPPITTAAHLLGVLLVAGSIVLLLGILLPLFVVVVVIGPLTALLVWALLWHAERRYRAALDRALPTAAGRLATYLRSGTSVQGALGKVVADLPPSPLRGEWAFLVERLGTPLASGGIATPMSTVTALAAQTPSLRHATLLNHLEVALGQPQEVQARRVEAAYQALQASEQRRSAAATELAQMRYSGVAVGLAGTVMAAYLLLTQWERVVLAYSTPLGAIVGVVVVLALAAPVIGGVVLAQAEDMDY